MADHPSNKILASECRGQGIEALGYQKVVRRMAGISSSRRRLFCLQWSVVEDDACGHQRNV